MSHDHSELLANLERSLTEQHYNTTVIHNQCVNAAHFLRYLDQRQVCIEDVTPEHVADYLRGASRAFRRRHGYAAPASWRSIPRAGIHALLRFVRKRWPPEPSPRNAGEALCQAICAEYRQWLGVHRGLADATIVDLLSEAKPFLSWYTTRSGAIDLVQLKIADIDAYCASRAPRLTRKSRKDVAERLRSLMRYLHHTGRVSVDLSVQIIAPMLYAYEGIPSALTPEQIATVLRATRSDRSPIGLRDYAVLMLLSTYGIRAGEIARLRLEDIDWRAEKLHVRHSKTGAHSFLPLMAPVGDALLSYLRRGRPQTDAREVFIRARAPYRPMLRFNSAIGQRLAAAGVQPKGKWGPHAFRHARAIGLLRASVPRKIIGDLLGHRSEESTIPYLKLATEDLRAIALEIPGTEVRP